jgi:hypothetical protein
MTNSYTLVNPIVIGNLNTSVSASNNAVAAKEIYTRLSNYFNKTQKSLIFTIQKVSDQNGGGVSSSKPSYYSFKVSEVEKNGQVVFTIARYNGKINYDKLTSVVTKIHNKAKKNVDLLLTETSESINLSGGSKHKKDDSDSFDEILEELEDEEIELSKKNKNKFKQDLVFPYFYVPTLVDPISFYWYVNVYDDLTRLLIPSFVPTLTNTRIMIDLGP